MKILFISTLYAPHYVGGAERVVQSLAEGLTSLGHQSVVVSLGKRRGVQTARVNDVKAYYVGIKNLYWPFEEGWKRTLLKPLWHGLDAANPWMAHEVGRILDAEQPDLVHTHTLSGFSTLSWYAVKRRGLPLVHTLHDYYLLCPKATMFRGGQNCLKPCARCLPYVLPRRYHSNQADAVSAVSGFVLERHLDLGFFENTPERRAIYNGFEAESERPLSYAGSSPVRFGYLGRLDPTKGIAGLLAAFDRLPPKKATMKVAGEGPTKYVNELRARHKSPDVAFLGYVAADSFFEGIDALVVPSVWHEPSGRVISEAYAYGVPVIGSRRGGIPELIEEGRTGFLFDPDRPDDLVQKMRTFTADRALAESMRGSCLEKAASLNPKNITAEYLKMYADAAGGR